MKQNYLHKRSLNTNLKKLIQVETSDLKSVLNHMLIQYSKLAETLIKNCVFFSSSTPNL